MNHHVRIIKIVSSLVLFLLSGCVSMKNLPTDMPIQLNKSEGVIIVGLLDEGKSVFHAGSLKDGVFKNDGYFPKGFYQQSGAPYIVQKGEANKPQRAYGMVSFSDKESKFTFGCKQDVPLIQVEPGKVKYYGSFELISEGDKKYLKHSYNLSAAKEYIAKNYPANNWKIEKGEIIRAKTDECTPGVIIIFI